MRIDILCPSRGRPDLAYRMVESLRDTALRPQRVKVHFYLNDDDAALQRYYAMLEPFRDMVVIHQGPDRPAAWSWNDLATKGDGDLMMLAGDDCVFITRGWDNAFGTAYEQFPNGYGVLSFNDGRSLPGTGHPHPVMSRPMYQALGYFVPPMFLHWCVDIWTVTLAKRAKVFTYLDDVTIDHVKPVETTGADETHKRIRSGEWHKHDHEAFKMASRWLDQDVELIHKLAFPKPLKNIHDFIALCQNGCKGGETEGMTS